MGLLRAATSALLAVPNVRSTFGCDLLAYREYSRRVRPAFLAFSVKLCQDVAVGVAVADVIEAAAPVAPHISPSRSPLRCLVDWLAYREFARTAYPAYLDALGLLSTHRSPAIVAQLAAITVPAPLADRTPVGGGVPSALR